MEKCPCGSGNQLNDCCGPIIDGTTIATTAEALMRSRYTAYTLKDDDYLRRTWHPDTCPDASEALDDDETVWTGLQVLRAEQGGSEDNEGVVEFIATCSVKNIPSQLHETSQFLRHNGYWVYVEGTGQQPIRRDNQKVGRNDPCPCGSGKKYKKCCGA